MPSKKFVFTEPAADATDEQKKAFVPEIIGIKFTFEDESTQTLTAENISDAMKLRAMWHGFSQKIGDSYAGAGKAESPLAFAKDCVKETIAQIYAGEWRAASGEGGPRVTDLAVALARLTGKPQDATVAFVETLDDEQKKAYRAKPKIKAMLALIASEKAQARAQKLAQAAGAVETAGEEEEITID